MPDSRLAQFIIGAQMIDEAPALVIGAMAEFLIMRAVQVQAGAGTGINYTVWHPKFPAMPLMSREQMANPAEAIPWITPTFTEVAEGVFCYTWTDNITSVVMFAGYFRVTLDDEGNVMPRQVTVKVEAPKEG